MQVTGTGLVVNAGSNITTNAGATVTFAGAISGGTAPTIIPGTSATELLSPQILTPRASPRPIQPLMATGAGSMALPATM